MIVLRKNLYVKDLISIVVILDNVWRKIPDLCIGWKKWLSAPDSNQWCLPGCITTIFSPGIIVVWIWNDNAAPKVDGCESGMTPTVLPQFPSTGPKLMSCPCWYTRSAFPVPTASFCPFGTPARLLYQWCAPVYSVHTKASSRTFSVLWSNRRPVLPGMKSYAHLKQHSLDN